MIDIEEMRRVGREASQPPWKISDATLETYCEEYEAFHKLDRATNEWTVFARNNWSAICDELEAGRKENARLNYENELIKADINPLGQALLPHVVS